MKWIVDMIIYGNLVDKINGNVNANMDYSNRQ